MAFHKKYTIPGEYPVPIEIDLEKKADELGIEFFIPSYSLLSMNHRGAMVPKSAIRDVQKIGMGGHPIAGFDCTIFDAGVEAVPDPYTFIQLPWDKTMGWVACNLYSAGKPYAQCPRRALIKAVEHAKGHGFVLKTGVEVEFMLLKPDKNEPVRTSEKDFKHYIDPNAMLYQQTFIKRILTYMGQLGWAPYVADHECGPSQFEINFRYEDCLTTADRHLFLRFMLKEVARQEGVRASFIPITSPSRSSGMHINVSLWDVKDNTNLFLGAEGYMGVSDVARHFMAGLLKHAKGMTVMLCPTVNSYKRIFGFLTCLNVISYAKLSKTPLMRVASADRVELRSPDTSANPYISQAATLIAGLDGVVNKIPLDPKLELKIDLEKYPKPDHLESLPKCLGDAIQELEKDRVLFDEILGKDFLDAYLKMRTNHWEEFLKQITAWEIDQVDSY